MDFAGEHAHTSAAMILYNERRNRLDVHKVPSEVQDHETYVSDSLVELDTDLSDVDDVHTNMRSILGQPEVYL